MALTAWTTSRSSTSSGSEFKKKRVEEEEERKQELADEALDDKLDAEFDALVATGPERLTSRQNARLSAVLRERAELVERRTKRRTMRKRKKRRKRKTPRTSSSCCHAHRRHRQCMAGFPGAPRAVFFPSVVKPKMLLLGRFVSERQLSVACAWLVLLITFSLCSLLLSAGRVVHCLDKPPAPRDSAGAAGPDREEEEEEGGEEEQEEEEEEASSYSSSSSTVACSLCWFCWLRCTSRYVPFCRHQAQDAPHHGRYGPEGLFRGSSSRSCSSLSWRRGFSPWSRLRCGPSRFPSCSWTR